MTLNNKTNFVCPFCKGNLAQSGAALHCPLCKKNFFSLLGIYDFTGAYNSAEELLKRDDSARTLCENYDKGDYSFLVGVEDELSQKWRKSLPDEIRALYADFSGNMAERGALRYSQAKIFMKRHGVNMRRKSALDMGCSSGATLFHIAKDFEHVFGLEPSFSKLILAKKFMEQSGAKNVTLICGYGESLPFRDNSFDFIHALNVMEHFADQKKAIEEMHRILNYGGALCFDSRNRYDIFKPEPHVKARFVGFVPRRWQKGYVARRRNMRYDGIKLLSYYELSAMLKPKFKRSFKIGFPEIKFASKSATMLYEWVKKAPGLSSAIKMFFPTYQVVCVKEA